MALQELPSALRQLTIKHIGQRAKCLTPIARRYASGEATAPTPSETPISEDLQDLEAASSFTTKFSREAVKDYDPVKRAKDRKYQLPASRYVVLQSTIFGDANVFQVTNIDPQDTIADRYTLINLLPPQIPRRESLSPGHFHTLVSNKHGRPRYPRIS
jgi:hypothetical protein